MAVRVKLEISSCIGMIYYIEYTTIGFEDYFWYNLHVLTSNIIQQCMSDRPAFPPIEAYLSLSNPSLSWQVY